MWLNRTMSETEAPQKFERWSRYIYCIYIYIYTYLYIFRLQLYGYIISIPYFKIAPHRSFFRWYLCVNLLPVTVLMWILRSWEGLWLHFLHGKGKTMISRRISLNSHGKYLPRVGPFFPSCIRHIRFWGLSPMILPIQTQNMLYILNILWMLFGEPHFCGVLSMFMHICIYTHTLLSHMLHM